MTFALFSSCLVCRPSAAREAGIRRDYELTPSVPTHIVCRGGHPVIRSRKNLLPAALTNEYRGSRIANYAMVPILLVLLWLSLRERRTPHPAAADAGGDDTGGPGR